MLLPVQPWRGRWLRGVLHGRGVQCLVPERGRRDDRRHFRQPESGWHLRTWWKCRRRVHILNHDSERQTLAVLCVICGSEDRKWLPVLGIAIASLPTTPEPAIPHHSSHFSGLLPRSVDTGASFGLSGTNGSGGAFSTTGSTISRNRIVCQGRHATSNSTAAMMSRTRPTSHQPSPRSNSTPTSPQAWFAQRALSEIPGAIAVSILISACQDAALIDHVADRLLVSGSNQGRHLPVLGRPLMTTPREVQ